MSEFPNQLVSLPEYELILVPMDKLITDDSYQRQPQAAHVRKIADSFEGIKFRPLTGNRRPDGTVAVVDGLQRTTALSILGWDGLVPVVVPVEVQSREGEATMFLAMNMEAKPVRAIDAFQAQVTSKNPFAVKINAVLDPLGLSVNSSRKDMSISAAGCLRAVVTECGGLKGEGSAILEKSLTALVIAYGGMYESLSASMIRGVAGFLFKIQEKYVDMDLVAEVLEARDPKEWVGASEVNQTIHRAISRELLDAYFEAYSDLYMMPSSLEEMAK